MGPKDAPLTDTCVDSPQCNVADIKGSTCYDKATRDKCCATCKQYETGIPDCLFGDRNRRCPMYVNFSPRICRRNSDICCESCKNKKAGETRRIVITRTDPNNGRRGPLQI